MRSRILYILMGLNFAYATGQSLPGGGIGGQGDIRVLPIEWYPGVDTLHKSFPVPQDIQQAYVCINCEVTGIWNWQAYTGDPVRLTNMDLTIHSLPFFLGPFADPEIPGAAQSPRERIRGSLTQVFFKYIRDTGEESFAIYSLGVGQEPPTRSILRIQCIGSSVLDFFDPVHGPYVPGVGYGEVLNFPGLVGPVWNGGQYNYTLGPGSPWNQHMNLPPERYQIPAIFVIDNEFENSDHIFAHLRISGGSSRVYEQKSLKMVVDRAYYGVGKAPRSNLFGRGKERIEEVQLRAGGSDNRGNFVSDAIARQLLPGKEKMGCKLYWVYIAGLPMGAFWLSEGMDQDYLARVNQGDDDQFDVIRTAPRPVALSNVDPAFPGTATGEGASIMAHYGLGFDKVSWLPGNIPGQLSLIGLVKHGTDSLFLGQCYYDLLQCFSTGDSLGTLAERLDVEQSIRNIIFHDFIARTTDIGNNNTIAWRKNKGPVIFQTDDFDLSMLNPGGSVFPHLLTNPVTAQSALGLMFRVAMREQPYRNYLVTCYQDRLNTDFRPEITIPVMESTLAQFLEVVDIHRDAWYPNGLDTAWETQYGDHHFLDFLQNNPAIVWDRLKAITQPLNNSESPEAQLYDLDFDLGGLPPGCGELTRIRVNSVDDVIGSWGHLLPFKYFGAQHLPVHIEIEVPPGYVFLGWDGMPTATEAEFDLVLSTDTVLRPMIFEDTDYCLDRELLRICEAVPGGDTVLGDWFELWNPSTTDISLYGMGLSDRDDVIKYQFPNDSLSILRSNERLLLLADREPDDVGSGERRYVGFKLDARRGETIYLSDPSGNLVHQLEIPAGHPVGYSYGLCGDDENPGYLTPTPGTTNDCDALPLSLTDQIIEKLVLFPNPATHTLFFYGTDNGTSISVLDIHGKIFINDPVARVGQGLYKIEVADLPAGIYFLRTEPGAGYPFAKW